MLAGQHTFSAPTSFSARRPNASNLPDFELPPPPLSAFHQKQYSYPALNLNPIHPATNSLASVGNLLTPPSINTSSDSLSPRSGATSASSQNCPAPYPPASGGMAPPLSTQTTAYAFQPSGFSQSMAPGRAQFSPLISSLARNQSSLATTDTLPPPPYEITQYPAPMSAPNLPAMQQQQILGNAMLGGQAPVSAPVTQASPVSAQEAFVRAPPTPTYYKNSQPPSANPQQGHFAYSTGRSPVQQSPITATESTRLSPVNGHGAVSALQSHVPSYSRQYNYHLPGPVLSNISNPSGQLQMVGSLPPGMVGGFNSGHAAHMQQLYASYPQQQSDTNQRPFRCDQCPQSFNRNHDLKRHKRIHLAVKPFPCGNCDKSFSRKDALKVSDIFESTCRPGR